MVLTVRNRPASGFGSLCRTIGYAVLFCGVLNAFPATALSTENTPEPPDPLTLEAALQYAEYPHPDTAQAELNLAKAKLKLERVRNGADRQQWRALVKESFGEQKSGTTGKQSLPSQSSPDMTDANIAIAESLVRQAELELGDAIQSLRIKIAQHYFDVLSSDYDYALKNEENTMAFIRFNTRKKGADEYGLHSEIEVLEREVTYQKAFAVRESAAIHQRRTRIQLGVAMGLEDYVPSDLLRPDVSEFKEKELPDLDEILGKVMESSLELALAKEISRQAGLREKAKEEKLKARMDSVLANSGSSEVATPERIQQLADSQLMLHQQSVAAARERNRLRLNEVELILKTKVVELWEKLFVLQTAYKANKVNEYYRDRVMDRNRTQFELEIKTSLGDARVEISRVETERMKILYDAAMTWASLDKLMGKQVFANEN